MMSLIFDSNRDLDLLAVLNGCVNQAKLVLRQFDYAIKSIFVPLCGLSVTHKGHKSRNMHNLIVSSGGKNG